MDDWWLITDDWWLMIDDWWLMSDEWWLMIDDKINTNIIWNVRYSLPQGGSPLGQTIWGPFHIISVINHQSSIISHQSSIINHQSSMINDQSIVSTHQSSICSRHAVITFFLTCMQRRGHSLGTFGHHRRPSGILGNHRKHSVNPRQLSETIGNLHCDRCFTRFLHLWLFFYTFSSPNWSNLVVQRYPYHQ